MLLLRTLALLLALAAVPARGAELPEALVGVWASAESEFEDGRLVGGVALYVMKTGKAALVGAPLPVGRCADGRLCTPIVGALATLSYDPETHRLAIRQQAQTLSATHELAPGTISWEATPGQPVRLQRRSATLPAAVETLLSATKD